MQEKETILFFHGWGLSPYSYKKILTKLSEYYNVISPKINHLDYKNDLKKLSDRINCKVIVVSHSAGSIPAEEFTKKYPSKVRRIVLLNPTGFSEKSLLAWFVSWLMHLVTVGAKHPRISSRIALDFFRTSILHPQKAINSGIKLVNTKLNSLDNKTLAIFATNDNLVSLPTKGNVVKFEVIPGDHYWAFTDTKRLIDILKAKH